MDSAIGPRRSSAFRMENPFSLKVFQVFTGFGVGCGIGIGVGRPIYLGAIPVLQQVMSATSGATDAFSGVGRHVNGSLKKLGMKNIEAGIGCGVGVGHGFGVGLALKPGMVHLIQSSLEQLMSKIMMNAGSVPGLPSASSVIPGSAQSSNTMLSGAFNKKVQSSSGSVLDLESKTTGNTFQPARFDESPHQEPTYNSYESKGTLSEKSIGSRTEKVINNFLQNPLFRNDEKMELNELLLKHQQVIEELMEENQKLRQILVEDLNVPPSKLQINKESKIKTYYSCSDCFECRRRDRRRTR
ncbi:uncharacterized protein LOC103713605 isoform X2 [Phoenix dactylifera]|uniref:Uncharacterized protein LOC103713605 isoform X2 n=1 Tax=Phoenix dactylifera TaxID=42345 RepID=A0A8B8J816_PHODC|nr:uncharacterized protein LOC103713605 isoform X2 [Phoenix dactylifera]